MLEMRNYIENIKNTNTKLAVNLVYTKLKDYSKEKGKDIETLNEKDIEDFIIKNYSGKSETTVANAIVNIKKLFETIGKREMLKKLTFLNLKDRLGAKPIKVYTPSEIKEIVDNLINYQDKALILLTYIGLYDKDFETIRHLKEYEIFEDCIITNNTEYKINSYIYGILEKAKSELVYNRYNDCSSFNLRGRNGYLIRGQLSPRTTKDYVSAITLKKRYEILADFLEDEDLTPVAIKNSKLVYDMTKLEYDFNSGFDINQLALIDYAKDNNKVGCIEKLNVAKKKIKERMLEEIIKKEDIVCP